MHLLDAYWSMIFKAMNLSWHIFKSSSSPSWHWGWPSQTSCGWTHWPEMGQRKYDVFSQARQSWPGAEHDSWQEWGSNFSADCSDSHLVLLIQIRSDWKLYFSLQNFSVWKSKCCCNCCPHVWLLLNTWSQRLYSYSSFNDSFGALTGAQGVKMSVCMCVSEIMLKSTPKEF